MLARECTLPLLLTFLLVLPLVDPSVFIGEEAMAGSGGMDRDIWVFIASGLVDFLAEDTLTNWFLFKGDSTLDSDECVLVIGCSCRGS